MARARPSTRSSSPTSAPPASSRRQSPSGRTAISKSYERSNFSSATRPTGSKTSRSVTPSEANRHGWTAIPAWWVVTVELCGVLAQKKVPIEYPMATAPRPIPMALTR